MQPDLPFIQSAPALWSKLIECAGLQLTPDRSSSRGYDDEIYGEIRRAIVGSDPGEFEKLLVDRRVTVEHLLTAFFTATAPFARMLIRILQLYQKAAASKGSTNINISIQTNEMDGKFEFDLNAFMHQVKLTEFALITQNMRMWSHDDMWNAVRLLPENNWSQVKILDDSVRSWIVAYQKRDHEFPSLPPFRRTGVSWIDETLAKLEADLNGIIDRARELFGGYQGIRFDRSLPSEPADLPWSAEDIRRATHDFWPLELVIGMQATLEEIHSNPSSQAALTTLNNVRGLIDRLKSVEVSREERIEKLLEILGLPVWKRREAMYAVWVCASVLLDLDYCDVQFDVKDGTLEFPFRATKVAELTRADHPTRRIEFWSELRTPAAELVGKRTSAIQPDYRFRVVDDGKPPLDVVLIECKQYKRSSVSNFSSAIIDYATACPSARVFLCNYGPVGESVVQRVRERRPEVANRIDAQGLVRPQGDGELRLRKAMRDALAPYLRPPDGIGWPVKSVKIELTWISRHTDLDLHVRQGSHWTNFSAPTGIPGSMYSEDQRGDREPASSEDINLKLSGNEPYSIFVHRYGGPATLQQTGAEVLILGFPSMEKGYFHVSEGVGDWWHVADLRLGFSEPIPVDKILREISSRTNGSG